MIEKTIQLFSFLCGGLTLSMSKKEKKNTEIKKAGTFKDA
jgi:hypothetical protein